MNKGFTLVELLVVVLIIAILASVALPQYARSVEKARAAEAIQILGDLARSQRIYHMTAGQYITDMKKLDLEVPGIDPEVPTNNVAYTQFFGIQISEANADYLKAHATRVKAGTHDIIAGGDQQYTILLEINSDGDMTRKCVKELGSDEVNPTCKSIANSADGVIK